MSVASGTEEPSWPPGGFSWFSHLFFHPPPERRKFFEMSSFVETKGMDILKGFPIEFVEYP